MGARRRQPKVVLALFAACSLASCTGCNPLGWGISQVKTLIHHHAYRPVMSDRETGDAGSVEPQRMASGETSARPA